MNFSLFLRILHHQKYSKSLSFMQLWRPASLTQQMKNRLKKQTHNQQTDRFSNNQLYLKS